VQGKKRPVCGLDKYLGEKRWEHLPSRGVGSVKIGMFEKRWFAVIGQRIAAGEVGRLGFFARQQQESRGWGVPEPETAALDAVHLVQLPAESAEAKAWWAWLADSGIRLPLPAGIPVVWFPTRWPPSYHGSPARARAKESVDAAP
jgi:hypothetical protein